ncbi:uncharacterized protein LOC120143827 isoform X2 [Hibiscus syriacus]|uniref:uncharacterized protein LOC120143827 isoform X2 n=1 Tax=Hibiscus syriacus TaxID=106335 RepID=UPI001921BF4B|nr:uncharacterized protein LOC120143827 isoform X2 [Hibiscus syriacus]
MPSFAINLKENKRVKKLHAQSRNRREKTIRASMRRLKKEMEEIKEEQEIIKAQQEIIKAQRQVHEKFSAIELECEQLRNETQLIMHQRANDQLRVALNFNTAWLQSYLNRVLRDSQAGTELIAVQRNPVSSVGSNDPCQGSAC